MHQATKAYGKAAYYCVTYLKKSENKTTTKQKQHTHTKNWDMK